MELLTSYEKGVRLDTADMTVVDVFRSFLLLRWDQQL